MNFTQVCKQYARYIVFGIQFLILLTSVCSWLIHRGSAYSKTFALDEYILPETVVVAEDVTTDEIMGQSGVFLSTPALSLKKGIYQIQINYNADRTGSSVSVSCDLGSLEYTAPPAELEPLSHSAAIILEITRNSDNVYIQASFSGNGYLSITNLSIYETSDRYKKNIFYAFLLCLFISMGYYFKHSNTSVRRSIFALTAIFLVSCYPLYTDFLTAGHDMPFHLLRIDAIKEGLSHGTFPVKLHPLWAKDYGYAVGIFYGDAFLYFPAFLRLLGFSIQSAYKYYAALINLGTILISYYTFWKIFSSRKLGLLGCLAYTLAPYRLIDMYTRSSVGEYTAMMFFPLVLYGFYLIFTKQAKASPRKAVLLTALGMTGLIQSHVLSCLMVVFVVFLICIIRIRYISRWFLSLLSAAGLTIALNLNFAVPLLDFYREDVMINSPDWAGRVTGSFQANGLFPIQLTGLFGRSKGGAWPAAAGISSEPTLGVGIFLTLGILLFLYLLFIHFRETAEDHNFYPALLCMLLGCALLYMCTCYFPWDALISIGEGIKTMIHPLQFPWRLLAPATVLLTFVLCYAIKILHKCLDRYFYSLLAGCLVLLAVNCGWYFYDFSFTGEPYRIYHTYELDTMTMYSYDYLPVGTEPEEIAENLILSDGITSIESYRKLGMEITCSVTAEPEGGYIEFPLTYYKYYHCTDSGTGRELPVHAGTNNMVRADFPGNYSGSILIRFTEPWFWRLAELISFSTLIIVILLSILKYRCFSRAKP